MFRFFPAILLILMFCQCNNGNNDPGVSIKKTYKPGDRGGVDSGMLDISESRSLSELIAQRWDNKEDLENVSIESDQLEIPFRGFYLFNDGNMVKNPRNEMIPGRWSFDDKTKLLQFTLRNGTRERYIVHAIRYDELVVNREGEKGGLVKYAADGFLHKDLEDDPFYPSNLQWRMKPASREDDAALHKRLKDCLHFYWLYYIDNSKRNTAVISFYGLPGCFIWYAGGIHLKLREKLDKAWTNIFYDSKDADRAYILLDKMITKKYVWDKEETSWVKKNAGVLKQMEAKIDSL